MILENIIEKRITDFLGYGNIHSDIWFVCMEEGFDGTDGDLKSRLDATKDKVIIDIKDGMSGVLDHMRYFLGERVPIQRTWNKLIVMLLVFDGKIVTTELAREYQKIKFGRLDSNHCILDLMPLPSRSISEDDWRYSDFAIDYLSTRETYLQEVMPMRIRLYQEYISKYQPKLVIFFSIKYLPHWMKIAQCKFNNLGGFYFCKKDTVNYFIFPHPVARGLSNADWERMALKIKGIISDKIS